MPRPTINEATLNGDYLQATVWQAVEDGVAEPALALRTYDGSPNGPLIEIKQGDHEILINAETIPDLCKLLKRWIS